PLVAAARRLGVERGDERAAVDAEDDVCGAERAGERLLAGAAGPAERVRERDGDARAAPAPRLDLDRESALEPLPAASKRAALDRLELLAGLDRERACLRQLALRRLVPGQVKRSGRAQRVDRVAGGVERLP